ncbi:hypothetical protein K435DRAFT_800427 [Dendrothele bispora CBS 962.96]|uniref:Uncharacterized protein n=1 Tax=Dendrothele bispora (strain CBS 962.96) TaxID=1314807 RepID=A0A4S8LT73_DENBC|nr:hypothetical protein K435DRAFT_800425 [Dendrothele bispora CBS 962.96]THU92492.1 hypothetical protein K435DRAFT_800427 [Dendrothele bispora CBS 962.96]
MSFLVAYISLARTAPHHGKRKGKGRGENYEDRHKAQFKTQIHESIFKVYKKSMESAKKGNLKRSLWYMVHDLLELYVYIQLLFASYPFFIRVDLHEYTRPNHLKTNPTANIFYEAPVLMKESLDIEIKRKTGQGSVPAITGSSDDKQAR